MSSYETHVGRVDPDGDGVEWPADCDNADPAVGIGYRDGDQDGWGGHALEDCRADPGFVLLAGDCDDADPAIFPGSPELCDLLDNDCDGAIDEDPEGGFTEAYADVDGDGWGGELVQQCAHEPGLVSVAGDCDDADPEVHPEAAPICGDGVDNNCDGALTECSSDEALLFVVGSLESQLGAAVAGGLSFEGEPAIAIGAPQMDTVMFTTGAVYFVAAHATGVLEAEEDALHRVDGQLAYDDFGRELSAEDLDGDGYAELLIGAPVVESMGTQEGAVYLGYGPQTPETEYLRLLGSEPKDGFGSAIAIGRDVLAISAPRSERLSGAVYLMDRWDVAGELDATPKLRGGEADGLGASLVLVGDAIGDGIDVFAVGAPDADLGGEVQLFDAGGFWIGALYPDDERGALGTSLSATGDLDGDGLADLAVGDPSFDRDAEHDLGAVHLVRLNDFVAHHEFIVEDIARGSIFGAAQYAEAGISVAQGETAEVSGLWVVASPGSGSDAAAGLFPTEGSHLFQEADAYDWREMPNVELAAAGDVIGSSVDELLLGAPLYGSTDHGALAMISWDAQ